MRQMKRVVWLLGASMSGVGSSHAKNCIDMLRHHGWSPVVSLAVGQSYAQGITQHQIIRVPSGDYQYSFQPYPHQGSRSLFGAYIAFEHATANNRALQLGVSYFQPLNYNLKGQMTSSNVPGTGSYQYTYSVNLQQLLAEGKMVAKKGRYLPYISAGLGVSWLDAGSFSSNFSHNLKFESQVSSHLGVGLGAGVDVKITDRIGLGFGYRWMYFGSYKTLPGSTILYFGFDPISAHNVYANAVMVNILFFQGDYQVKKSNVEDLDPE